MDKISNVEVEPLQDARFVKPFRVNYSQNETRKTWEVVSVHPSVSIIIYNTDRKKLVFVRQFRPAVYFSNYPRSEREIPSSPPATSPCKSIATQSTAPQSTQHTQTARATHSTEETQTTHHQGGSDQQEKPDGEDGSSTTTVSQSTQGTQSKSPECTHQSTQSHISHCHQSSQSDVEPSTIDGDKGNASKKSLSGVPGSRGITLELCAGIVDKAGPLADIAREEVLEECGYDVKTDTLQKVIACRAGVGSSGDLQTLFYVEVTDEMKVGEGGGLASEGEMIEVVELSVDEARALLQQEEVVAPAGLLFALMWFMANKAN